MVDFIEDNRDKYGARKVWRDIKPNWPSLARCTVERLMRRLGLRGVTRGRAFKVTTIPDLKATRPEDLVQRKFQATQPNQLWVADLTYVATWRGFVYVASVVDVFSLAIVGWRVSTPLRIKIMLDVLKQCFALEIRGLR